MSNNPSLETLPDELAASVAVYLAIEDVLACTQVSRALHATWTGPTVATALCNALFPGLPRPHTFAAFKKASRRYLGRRAGRFTSWSHHVLDYQREGAFSLDRALHPDGVAPEPGARETPAFETPAFHGYRAGIMAWSVGNRVLVVDDLRTRTRRVLDLWDWGFMGTLNHGRRVFDMLQAPRANERQVLVGESLLVIIHRPSSGVASDLCVHGLIPGASLLMQNSHLFNLETNNMAEVKLPVLDHRVTVRGNRALVIGPETDVYIVEHHGSRASLTKVDAGGLLLADRPLFTQNPRYTEIFVDPFDAERYFVLSVGTISGLSGIHLLVSELCESRYVATHDYGPIQAAGHLRDLPHGIHTAMTRTVDDTVLEFTTKAEDCDEHGLVLLAGFGVACDSPRGNDVYREVRITFNTVTKLFGTQRHVVPNGIDHPRVLRRCWNQQTYIPHYRPLYRPPYRRQGLWEGALLIHMFDAEGASGLKARECVRTEALYTVNPTPADFRNLEGEDAIWCDGEFMVCVSRHSEHCLVWAFDEGAGGDNGEGLRSGNAAFQG